MKKSLTTNERNARAKWRVLMASAAILGLTGGSALAAGAEEAQPGAQGDQSSDSEYRTDTPRIGSSPAGPEQGTSESTAASEEGAASAPAGTLYEMTAEQLTGKAVIDSQGDSIGEVEELVIGGPASTVHAVISVGGLLGVGDTEVAVPLDDLQLQDDKLVIFESKDQLKNRPEYKEENYVQIEQTEQPLADFAQFETHEKSERP
jgi:sporulation protein YlmC with PRC-barrel domain